MGIEKNYWFWHNWYYKYIYSNFSQNLTMWEEKTTLYFYHNLDIIMEMYKSRFILCWHPGVVDEVLEDNAPHQFLQVFPVACDVLASPLLVHGRPLSAHTSVSHAKRTPAKTKKERKAKISDIMITCVFSIFSSKYYLVMRIWQYIEKRLLSSWVLRLDSCSM